MTQKYVRLKEYDSIIVFPEIIQHKEFRHMEIISAGSCHINGKHTRCFGESYSLGLKSDKKDSELLVIQLYGMTSVEYDEFYYLNNQKG